MKIVSRIIISILTVSTALSCAKQTTIEYSALELNSLEQWVKANVPDAIELMEGVYYEVISSAPADAPAVEAGNWIKVDYQVLDMSGNIIYSRSEATARRLSTFTKYTHYVPDYFMMPEKEDVSMLGAFYESLREMKVGDVWRIYSVSTHLYGNNGLTNEIGYGGQYSLAANKPAIVDNLRIVEIVEDPDLYEQTEVEKKAFSRAPEGWNMSDDDAVMRHYYLQFLGRGAKEDIIEADSSAKVYFKASFLDGFLFDTNIDSVWTNRYGGRRYDSDNEVYVDDTTAISLTRPADFSTSNISTEMPKKVFEFLFAEEREERMLRYGDSLRIVLTSMYAYGEGGRTGYVTSGNDSYYYYPSYYNYGGYSNYGYGGYGSYGYGGYNYYDMMYGLYNSSSYNSSTVNTYPRAEVRPFTPVVYELVVKRKNEISDDKKEDDKE